MASPQIENGYTKIANELLEALTKIRIPGEARQVFDFIIRKTYGFNQKDDAISLSQFCLATGLKKNAVCKGLAKLKQMNLITQKGYSIATIYRVNKDFSTWQPLPKKGTSTPKGEKGVPQKVNKQYPKKSTTKDSKETITKEKAAAPLDPINHLISLFQKINPGINYANSTNRKSAEWIINKYGEEKAFSTAHYAISIMGKPYAPTITTPYQLKENLGKLLAYYRRENSEKSTKHLKL